MPEPVGAWKRPLTDTRLPLRADPPAGARKLMAAGLTVSAAGADVVAMPRLSVARAVKL